MLNPHLEFRSIDEEKPFILFIIVVIIFTSITLTRYVHYESQSSDEGSTVAGEVVFENRSFSDQETLILQNGETDSSTMTFTTGNWSEEGWKLRSITARIINGETTSGDFACDTVSTELILSNSQGDEPTSSNTTAQDDSCSLMTLDMSWPAVNDTSITHHSPPFVVEVEVKLDVNSTVPLNDQDEEVVVEIVVNLSRIIP